MFKALRYLVSKTYKPLLVRYLSKTRVYRYKNIRIDIPPEVFHPGFFFSTKFLLSYIEKMQLKDERFLELGCGSGLISIVAALRTAKVTAIDINPLAVAYLEKNSKRNNVQIEILHSDLFQNIPKQEFDIIAINPPFYKKHAVTVKDHAWFCGENGEFFSGLFSSLGDYINKRSIVLMVLSEACDMQMIKRYAEENMFKLDCVYRKQNVLEKNYIMKIERQE